MDAVAIILALVLVVIAAVHLAWGLGAVWPASDEKSLSDMVVGTPGAEKMPSRPLTILVALLIFAAALWPLMWQALIPYPHAVPQSLIWLGMWVLTGVFLLRGLATYVPGFPDTVEPFRNLNKLYYSPLCIALGFGFMGLVLNP